MNVARFIAFCGKLEYGRSGCIFAYISMTTRARDFKFAGTPVQRLQLAMVALTQKSFSAQYAWFSRGGSQITLYPFITQLLPVSNWSTDRGISNPDFPDTSDQCGYLHLGHYSGDSTC